MLGTLAFYPSLAYNLVRNYIQPQSWQWYNRVDEGVVLGALPFKSMLQDLKEKEKVGGVVCCTEDFETKAAYQSMDEEEWKKEGIKFHHVPMQDFTGSTSRENIQQAVDFIEEVNKEGKSVYIHCKAGRTRSATIACCYLMKKYDYLPNVAMDILKNHRRQVILRQAHWRSVNEYRSSGLIPSSAEERDETPEEKIKRLEKELKEACRHAFESDRRCDELKKLQKSLDNEVQDLTETLFQEAYKLANAAEARREHAEKLLSEALLKVDLLQAEVKALKEIVKSTGKRSIKDKGNSHRGGTPLTPKTKSKNSKQGSPQSNGSGITMDSSVELDPVCFPEFKEWRKTEENPEDSEFIKRILTEDVKPCLTSGDESLSEEILSSIKKNTLEIEPISNPTGTLRTCAFTKMEKHCPYRLKTDSDKDWVFVSPFARNRITAVCDLFTYLRYLKNGIVKASDEDAFAEITVMKKNLALARFGFDFVTKMNAPPALLPTKTSYNENEARTLLNLSAGAYATSPQACLNRTFGSDASLYRLYTAANAVCDAIDSVCSGYTVVDDREMRVFVVFRGTKTDQQLLLEGWNSLEPLDDFYGVGLGNRYFLKALEVLWPNVEPILTDSRYKPCDPTNTKRSYHHGIEIWYPNDMYPNSTYYECLGNPYGEDFNCSDMLSFKVNKYKEYVSAHRHYFGYEVPDYGKVGCDPNNPSGETTITPNSPQGR
ncbi:hypothetical protein FO519_006578 [Halicephalobus sp. NKZ332]|nr:hypothetical protein FO519_006578 [Halicephalobus sp. NKZ332]